ncbi:TetR/AcrR family transcriptional regulator C-terminal domain-containing protein [Streptomyces sp. NPDC101150]|uniref:TetR/AcrR family transcriptional regulator C-terminal domain-containing protein n=1 Tax=Streptomyces sp. NPDC101150 TaxID=3366114 RepID=UPI00381E4D30
MVESGRYPQFARRVVEAEDPTPEERFEFGLACVLDGVAARCLPDRTAAHRTDAAGGRSRTAP